MGLFGDILSRVGSLLFGIGSPPQKQQPEPTQLRQWDDYPSEDEWTHSYNHNSTIINRSEVIRPETTPIRPLSSTSPVAFYQPQPLPQYPAKPAEPLRAPIRPLSCTSPSALYKPQPLLKYPANPAEPFRAFLLSALDTMERTEIRSIKQINEKLTDKGPFTVKAIGFNDHEVRIYFGYGLMESLAKVIGEGCLLTMDSNFSQMRAIVKELTRGELSAENSKIALTGGIYSIQFLYNRTIMDKKRAILSSLNTLSLYPISPAKTVRGQNRKMNWSPKMNQWQKRSIHAVLNLQPQSVPAPYLICGPPGTGKTTTLVELILQITDKETQPMIIVCTPTNRAADNIIEKIPEEEGLKVLRFLSEGQMRKLENEKSIPGIAYNTTFSTKYTVVVCTIGVLHKLYDKGGRCNITPPTHLIVDEASQVPDTDMILALGLIESDTKFVMFGDDRQLGPVITEDELRSTSLAVSMFERLLQNKAFEESSVCLLENYRSVPGVVAPFNKLFYKNTLIPKVNPRDNPEMFELKLKIHRALVAGKTQIDPSGVYFQPVKGSCVSGESKSWQNQKEADAVLSFYGKLTAIGISANDIGIITPYTDQTKLLQKTIDCTAVTVGSVDSFQGQERSVIIVSTVRASGQSGGIGFVGSRKRLNVTLSRAKIALIIVGDDEHLKKHSKEFRELLQMDRIQFLGQEGTPKRRVNKKFQKI